MENFWNESLDFKIQQKKNEWIDFMLEISKKGKFKTCLEIGCYDGGTTVFLSNFCEKLITIDQPFPARFDEFKYSHQSDLYGTDYLKLKCDFNYISGNSHDISTLDKVKLILGEDKLDLLFIDGDHSYNGVKMDYEMYSDLVSDEGIIAFHDIHRSQFHMTHGCYVHDFWDEIKLNKNTKEFYDSVNNHEWGGIGVIYK
jgi:predicted O-methyltransferase YrrM